MFPLETLTRRSWLEFLSSAGYFGKSTSRAPPSTNVNGEIRRREYIALVGSLILIFLEGLIRIITLGLRKTPCDLPPKLSLIPFSAANYPILLQQVQEPLQFAIINTRQAVTIEAEIDRLLNSQLLGFCGPLRPFRLLRGGACRADRRWLLAGTTPVVLEKGRRRLESQCWRR